jgi:hypothetical protein
MTTYRQGVDTQMTLSWQIRNYSYDQEHHSQPATTLPTRWTGSSWVPMGTGLIPVSGDGTFSRDFDNIDQQFFGDPVYYPTVKTFRVRYNHANNEVYYSTDAQTTVIPRPPEFVGIDPETATIGVAMYMTITGRWICPTWRVPAGAPPLRVTIGGVPLTDPTVYDVGSALPLTWYINFLVPAGITEPGAKDVVITNPDGQSVTAPNAITFVLPPLQPRVDSVTPAYGPPAGGTLVTIRGAGFESGARVQFASEYASEVTVVDETELTCRTPTSIGWVLPVYVSVRNPTGRSGNRADAFTYRDPVTIASITPETGLVDGGTLVTITGTGFAGSGVIVVFDSDPDCEDCQGRDVTVIDSRTLTCLTPPHAAGAVDVAVFSPGLEGALLPDGYTYAEARVSARFRELYSQWVAGNVHAGDDVIDSGRFVLEGTMDLTDFDLATLDWESTFTYGPLNLFYGTYIPDWFQPVKLGHDPDYEIGRTSFTHEYKDHRGGRLMQVKLSWNRRRLWFSVTGWYGKESMSSPGAPSSEDGVWLVAQDYLEGPSAAGGVWAGRFTFGGPAESRTGTALVPYVAARIERERSNPTGTHYFRKKTLLVTGVGAVQGPPGRR